MAKWIGGVAVFLGGAVEGAAGHLLTDKNHYYPELGWALAVIGLAIIIVGVIQRELSGKK